METNAHVEIMLHLHRIRRSLNKVIREYSNGIPGKIRSRDLQYGVLTIHAIGHWSHDLAINIARDSQSFNKSNYESKRDLENAIHMNSNEHNKLWDPDKVKDNDVKETKGE